MSDRRGQVKKEKEILVEFDNHVKDIRQQLNEQLKCLDYKLDTQCAMVGEIQEYFKQRADLELQYSKNLDKLVKNTMLKHKAEKSRRENWQQYSTYTCWQHLLAITKKQSRDHAVLSEICNNQMVQRLSDIIDNSQRIVKKCREVGNESHDDIMQVLTSLQSAMRTYHLYQGDSKQAELKLQNVKGQKMKIEQQMAGKGGTMRKLKTLERQIEKKQSKYNENKLKALKARNDYLLSIEAANAAINKYFSDDLSDLMDCMDFGYHNSVGRAMMMYLSVHEEFKNSHQMSIDLLNKCITDLDSRADKQKFMEINNAVFMLPRKFEFQPCRGDEVRQICAQKSVQDQLLHEYGSIGDRQLQLKLENDEIWKTLETAEKTLMDMINVRDYEVSNFFRDDNIPPKSPHEAAKKRSDKMETESFYLSKFRDYTLSCNRLARLQSKCSAISKALGESKVSPTGVRPPSLPPNKPKKRRIGRAPLVGQPKLFGGSLEEYLEATGREIPVIMKSCIRIINLYGMHHQGIFRVSGAQVEINDFRNNFEKGDDPLQEMVDASDINSVAGVLKLYFRELREPIFPLHLFDELISCSKLQDNQERLEKLKELVNTLPRPINVVLRYLFAFLNHLTEYSDENMMDPYNLAICFGPTLLPIPPDRDQVTYQNSVNEVIKTILKHQDELFPQDGGEKYEKFILETREQADEHDEENSSIPSDDEQDILEATALYDFEGRTEKELTFRKGDGLIIFNQISNDWWEGCHNGKEGYIPDKYVSLKSNSSDDKKSHCSEDDKHSSTHSLPLKASHSSTSSSEETPIEKAISHPNITVKETDIIDSDTSPPPSPILPPPPETKIKQDLELLSIQEENVTEETTVVEVESVTSDTTPDDLASDIDSALAEVMSGLKSLEIQQKTDKRMSLPVVKTKQTPKHTPDLVLDLPEGGSDSPPAQEGSGPDSPTMSAAETFAKSNQSTLKKATSMPRSISSTDSPAVQASIMSKNRLSLSEELDDSPAAIIKRSQTTNANMRARTAQILEQKLEAGLKLSQTSLLQPQSPRGPQINVGSPPSSEKLKPPVKAKPIVMKKPGIPVMVPLPGKSPEPQKRLGLLSESKVASGNKQ